MSFLPLHFIYLHRAEKNPMPNRILVVNERTVVGNSNIGIPVPVQIRGSDRVVRGEWGIETGYSAAADARICQQEGVGGESPVETLGSQRVAPAD